MGFVVRRGDALSEPRDKPARTEARPPGIVQGRFAGTEHERLGNRPVSDWDLANPWPSSRAEDSRGRSRSLGLPAADDRSAPAERVAIEHDYGRWMIHCTLALLLLPALLGVLIVGGVAVVVLWLGEAVAGLPRCLESARATLRRR
jgi:hypothetical protein